MQKSFFEELKNTKLISCPNHAKEVEAGMEETECICEDCGENFDAEQNIFSEDFVWHPSERY
jgi:hypothetical protein